MTKKLLVAMSGGVDSAVTAARMIDAGYDVTGVHLILTDSQEARRQGQQSSTSEVNDARKVAEQLGIELDVWDFSQRFVDNVLRYFLGEYAAGRTPNPCVRCNQTIKFGALLDRALELGFDLVATGHYAQVTDGRLHRAAFRPKDQSYVLAGLTRHQLEHITFPLGTMVKAQVRAEAEQRGIVVAHKPDSEDICFIKDNDTAGFLDEKIGKNPGVIVDEEGHELGRHGGTHRFTVGQRKGLNLGVPSPDGKPRYVVEKNPDSARIVVGPAASLFVTTLHCVHPTWTGEPRVEPFRAGLQFRAHGAEVGATFVPGDGTMSIHPDELLRGVAPGQYAVAYSGDDVIGASIIDTTVRA